jgi:hypothetical protein
MRHVLLLLVTASTLAFAAGTAQAATVRVSQGEAQRLFQTLDSASLNSPALIRPFFENGRHYCSLDWHVIALALVDGGDASYTRQDFEAFRSTMSIVSILDGRLLATDQTATKRLERDLTSTFGFTNAYYFQQGVVLAPEELAVGSHTVTMELTSPSGTEIFTSEFFIDAAGTGTCL